ncbi:MFS transporter [Lasiodiplodia theobromae]|uniref:MFS transporter n=1 Tax=Lasiodiplodia theobromae TaxID=45133 RepID=UPI0015C3B6FB|nr:MFS transporter [Lasiodiplodia theobromae]KAF4539041.1 MFS transporter [Lasiodiplodia theobromae]
MLSLSPKSPDGWPPGTLNLEDLSNQGLSKNLHPVPSNDPDEPLNWSKARKCVNFSIVLFYSLMAFVLLDIGTVIWGDLNAELGISYTNLNNSFAANCAGLAVGCIFLIPYTVKYGRRPIYIFSCSLMLATAIWQAKMQTVTDLILANVLSGIGGAVSEAIVQMTISDLFFVHQRATMNGLYILMVAAGTFLAPVAAGVAAVNQGWRWIWWWTAILLGVSLVLFTFAYEESKYVPVLTSAPVESQADTESIPEQGATKKDADFSEQQVDREQPTDLEGWNYPRKSLRQRFALVTRTPGDGISVRWLLVRFALCLFRFPAAAWTALVYASSLAWFSVILTTMSTYFTMPPYNFDAAQIGLLNLPPFIGSAIGLVFSGPMNDWLILKLAKRNGGVFEPEMRLWIALPSIVLTPLALFLYGFSLVDGRHWIIPCIGTAAFGVSFSLLGTVSLTYLTDCYRELVGDALVGVTFMRNALATIIVFALTPWIEAIGLRNMFLNVGCLSFGICLTTIPMMVYGKKMRSLTKEKYFRMARQ